MGKRHNNRTGREAKRRRRRHERRTAWSFERAGRTTSAALIDWPPLTFAGLQEAIDEIDRLARSHEDGYVFRCYGLSFIPPAARYLIKI
jgi:hypothetical protein